MTTDQKSHLAQKVASIRAEYADEEAAAAEAEVTEDNVSSEPPLNEATVDPKPGSDGGAR
ncbi:hypothetical protein [Ornithinimicrobium faecis]|uniref:Uncharacterized protein n=1 Tax=Ornithinimicrobium faecis TaxID=2934158 RepID=A0ABY4YX53_9MICO|nr:MULTISPECIES: hypothetical protein [unclassified Ornithinimicrobium]USQ81352.1 hypothetical protein NF556_06810 [Ornithinimicrobium sp. HY1793]